jgi:hypothetical protein
MFDSSGALIKTFILPGNEGQDFSLNLDPNGTDFWTGDSVSGLGSEQRRGKRHVRRQYKTA